MLQKPIRKRKNGTLQSSQRQLVYICLEIGRHDMRSKIHSRTLLEYPRRMLTHKVKKRGQAPDRNKAIQEEVSKLVEAKITREVHYHDWLSNPVMVKKHDGSWRMCVDFTYFKACPKDCYPLPEIDWKVESLCGYPFKCFLDAYKGYHQIQIAEEDEEKTTFHTNQRVFCYTKMLFGLKNAGATYRRLVDNAFKKRLAETWSGSGKGFLKHEKVYSGAANGNRTKTQRRANNVYLRSQGSSKCSPTNEKGLTASTNLFRQACLASLRNKLQFNGKTGFSTSTCYKKAEEILPGIPGEAFDITYWLRTSIRGQILADFIAERPDEEDPPIETPTEEVNQAENNKGLLLKLDILEERREKAAVRKAKSKAKMEKYYNVRVRNTTFRPGDFVYRNNEASHAKDSGKLGPKWEGPYEVVEALRKRAYMLRNISGDILPRT
nr:reverse transcriptase domain-containing protein [Tanacetum cinerariifolium]